MLICLRLNFKNILFLQMSMNEINFLTKMKPTLIFYSLHHILVWECDLGKENGLLMTFLTTC